MQVLLLQNVEGIFSYIKKSLELYRINMLIHNFALNNSVCSPELTLIQERFLRCLDHKTKFWDKQVANTHSPDIFTHK